MFAGMESKVRLISLLMILLFSIFPLTIDSIYLLITDNDTMNSTDSTFIFSFLWEMVSLILLWFILRKQGRTFKDIGFEFRKTDVLHGVLLYLAIYIVYIIALAISPNFSQAPKNIEFLNSKITMFYLAFIVINPFFEELIVRAYTITEFKYFIKKEEISVIISTLIQVSYHLYQGLIPALYVGIMFFIFSIYFAKSRRIVPVIMIHLIFDLSAMFELGK